MKLFSFFSRHFFQICYFWDVGSNYVNPNSEFLLYQDLLLLVDQTSYDKSDEVPEDAALGADTPSLYAYGRNLTKKKFFASINILSVKCSEHLLYYKIKYTHKNRYLI